MDVDERTKAKDTPTYNDEILALRDLALRSKRRNSFIITHQQHKRQNIQAVESIGTHQSPSNEGLVIQSTKVEEGEKPQILEVGSILGNPDALISPSIVPFQRTTRFAQATISLVNKYIPHPSPISVHQEGPSTGSGKRESSEPTTGSNRESSEQKIH